MGIRAPVTDIRESRYSSSKRNRHSLMESAHTSSGSSREQLVDNACTFILYEYSKSMYKTSRATEKRK